MSTSDKLREMILDINAKLKKKKLTAETLRDDSDLVTEMGFDSLDMTELMVLVEEAFKVKIDLADAQKIRSISAGAAYLDKKRAV